MSPNFNIALVAHAFAVARRKLCRCRHENLCFVLRLIVVASVLLVNVAPWHRLTCQAVVFASWVRQLRASSAHWVGAPWKGVRESQAHVEGADCLKCHFAKARNDQRTMLCTAPPAGQLSLQITKLDTLTT